jgi:hypothetical protein
LRSSTISLGVRDDQLVALLRLDCQQLPPPVMAGVLQGLVRTVKVLADKERRNIGGASANVSVTRHAFTERHHVA